MNETRRFPPPWRVRRTAGGYCVDTANGITVAYIYFVEGFRRHFDGRALTDDEARRIAAGIARLPELMRRPDEAAARKMQSRERT